jgi:hypothetical protein
MPEGVRTRLVPLALGLVAQSACGHPAGMPGGSAPDDAGAAIDVLLPLDGRDPRLVDGRDPRLVDAGIDTPDADPTAPDTTAPALLETSPAKGSSIWLHASVRLVFDEPIASIDGTTVTATVGGADVAADIVLEPPSTLAISFSPSVRGIGAVEILVSPHIADAAGNAMTTPIELALVAPAWDRTAIDRGYASGTPSIATGADGRVVAAWIVGSSGSHRAAVAELDGATWRPLGATLGTGDVTSAVVTLDTDGTPLVAFADGSVIHAARWTQNTWTELASPGDGSRVALATPPGGAPIVALVDVASVALRQLSGDSWQALGDNLALAAPCTIDPALAAPAAGTAVVGWIDTGQRLRVYRYDGSWTPYSSFAVGAGSTMSLAARGSSVAIAWEQWAGSYGVVAAVAASGATTWTQLGKPLDIDLPGDARAPAIAFDTGGAPIVAWTELVETAMRGGLARWSGSAWTIVGGVSWLPGTTGRPEGTRLAIDSSGAALVATTNKGDLVLGRFNGPETPALGMTSRPSLAGCALDPAAPPTKLSGTGCFDLSTPKQPRPHAGLVPFDVVAELWSDGAKKRRWIALPQGASATLGSNGSWVVPTGTLMVKQFDLETTPGDPSTRRPVETRFYIVDAAQGVQGFTYQWNVAGTDALLLNDGQFVVNWTMDDGSQHAHVYPSRAHCRSCHTNARGPVLGLRPEQLARSYDYGDVIADQLATLVALGVGPSSTPPAFTAPHDPSASWELRMRGYMHVNCSHCHNPQYITVKDLRYATPLSQTKLCESLVPGSPSDSVVYQRVTSRPGMPPLGTAAVDPLAQQMLGSWISGMTSCP